MYISYAVMYMYTYPSLRFHVVYTCTCTVHVVVYIYKSYFLCLDLWSRIWWSKNDNGGKCRISFKRASTLHSIYFSIYFQQLYLRWTTSNPIRVEFVFVIDATQTMIPFIAEVRLNNTSSVLNINNTSSVLNINNTSSVLNINNTSSVLNINNTSSVLNINNTSSVLNINNTSSVLNNYAPVFFTPQIKYSTCITFYSTSTCNLINVQLK